MSSAPPPSLAICLLDHLCPGDETESLIGDLLEEYARGRSGAWFWRQALAAIAVSLVEEVRAHIVLAFKDTVTGWALHFLLQFVAWGLLTRAHLWLRLFHDLPAVAGTGIAAPLTWLILWTPVWLGSGWYVGRLYRSHLAGMALTFALSVLAWKLLGLAWIIRLHAAGDLGTFPRLVIEFMDVTLPPAFIVLGALLATETMSDDRVLNLTGLDTPVP